jgi:hypothetical protein
MNSEYNLAALCNQKFKFIKEKPKKNEKLYVNIILNARYC